MRRIAFALAAAALAFAACSPATTTSPSPTNVAVQLVDFKIEPETLTLTGSTFTFAVTSAGPTPHNFSVRDDSGTLASTVDLLTGESDTVTATLEPGTYTYFCAFPGHESLGMRGSLTVTAE